VQSHIHFWNVYEVVRQRPNFQSPFLHKLSFIFPTTQVAISIVFIAYVLYGNILVFVNRKTVKQVLFLASIQQEPSDLIHRDWELVSCLDNHTNIPKCMCDCTRQLLKLSFHFLKSSLTCSTFSFSCKLLAQLYDVIVQITKTVITLD
jgi:hypothetical protein